MTGWKVQQISAGSTSTKEVEGPLLSMQMPQCVRLIVNPILGDASGINTIAATTQDSNEVYSLSGQRLSQPRKGVNIIGGKKVLVK